MFESLRGYYAMFVIGIKNSLAYKADFALNLFFRLASAFLMIFVWTAVYVSSNAKEIGGLTLPFIFSYFFIASAVRIMMVSSIDQMLQEDIGQGIITSSFAKPLRYVAQLVSKSLADLPLVVCFMGIPLMAIGLFLAKPSLSASGIVLAIVQMAIGLAITSTIDFFNGSSAIYFTNIWGLVSVVWTVVSILDGAMAPLIFYPQAAQNILFLTPLPLLVYMPVMTFLGAIPQQAIVQSIFVGLIWLALLLVAASLWWNRIKKRITSVGG